MAAYTIQAAGQKGDVKPTPNGTFKTIALTIEHEGEPIVAEWYTKETTAIPAPGSSIEGEVSKDPRWGWKFRKAFNGAGGRSGGGGKSPEESARIVRQHSQSRALELLAMRIRYQQDTNAPVTEPTSALVKQMTDFFYDDAWSAKP